MLKQTLQLLISTILKKWGKVTKNMIFGNDPLWQVNPLEAIPIYSHKVSKILGLQNAIVWPFMCGWRCLRSVKVIWTQGGIGGSIKELNNSLIHVFSGPVKVRSAEEAEIEAILYVPSMSSLAIFSGKRIIICSDLVSAVESIKTGLTNYFPLGKNLDVILLLESKFFLNYVPRNINKDEDQLTKKGLNMSSVQTYWASNIGQPYKRHSPSCIFWSSILFNCMVNR